MRTGQPARVATWLGALAALATACGGGTSGADASDPGGNAEAPATAALSVLAEAGEVERASGATTPAEEVDAVGDGDTVVTDETGLIELGYVDGSLTRVGPGTRFAIVTLAGDEQLPEVATELEDGRSWHRVSEAGTTDDRFTVETSVAVAAVRGTVFSVVCASGTCTFAVFEGEVAILVDGQLVALLTAGQELTIGPDGPGDVVDLTADDIADDDWYADNLDRDGLDPDEVAEGGDGDVAAGVGGPVAPREPLRVLYDYTDSSAEFDQVVVAWQDDRISLTVPGVFRWIDLPGSQILCDIEESGQCFELPDDVQLPGMTEGLAQPLEAFTGELPPFEVTDTREYAGRSASCGSYTDPETGDSGEVCRDDETGAVLFADGGDVRYVALEVSAPQPGDLEPTGPVEPFPQR